MSPRQLPCFLTQAQPSESRANVTQAVTNDRQLFGWVPNAECGNVPTKLTSMHLGTTYKYPCLHHQFSLHTTLQKRMRFPIAPNKVAKAVPSQESYPRSKYSGDINIEVADTTRCSPSQQSAPEKFPVPASVPWPPSAMLARSPLWGGMALQSHRRRRCENHQDCGLHPLPTKVLPRAT